MKTPQIALLLLLTTLVFGCNTSSKDENYENRGYVTKFSDFSAIKEGKSDKQEVLQTLGTPTTTSLFGEEQWIYAGGEVTKETFFEPKVKSYQSFTITFDESGIVKKVATGQKANLRKFNISKDETTTSGNSVTLFQQLLGNVGKFNPQNKMGPGGGVGGTTGRY
jgi:outer membrane protein assembly factor BamE (lipoprotein component of BamABCDE complex)